jgi:aminomethyltransferase
MSSLLRTGLYECHRRRGARLVEFAGWEMPLQYSGVISESLAVRRGAGMFDVSHMGRFRISGSGAFSFLERMTTNDVSRLTDGSAQYSLLCYPEGTCVDDIMVYRLSGDEFYMVVNAGNREKDWEWLESHAPEGVEMEDKTFATVMIAVQGPSAVEKVASLAGVSVKDVPRFGMTIREVDGAQVFLARTGYTGEDGFEMIAPVEQGTSLWEALEGEGVVPCGLGARDVLRLEAGLPLYGHELSDSINPIEAGLGWVCSKSKEFIGFEAIQKMRESGPPRKIMGIKMETRVVPREGYPVWVKDDKVGTITSGVFSPVLNCGIGFALLRSEVAEPNTPCFVEVRGKREPGWIVGKRFLKG